MRTFVAIPLPDTIKKSVQDWIGPFRKHDTSIKWVRPEGIHLTLKFLGEVEEDRFEKEFFLDFPQLLTPFQPIKIVAEGIGQFPSRGTPRVLWMGLTGEVARLSQLAQAVDHFFEQHGFEREKRPFSPHVTLARIREKPSSGFLKKWNEASERAADLLRASEPGVRGGQRPAPDLRRPISFGEFVADQVVFYRSELTKGGAVYRVIREFHLEEK